MVKDGRRYVYLRLVEAYRDADGRVRHRVLRTLGREDELKASGQLEQLAASFARLDPPPVGTRRHVGPLLLVHHYLHRLGLVDLIDAAAPMRGRAMLTHGEVIAALVANRLCGPAPLYDIAGWASSAAMAELFSVPAGLLNDDRLGRALEALAPVAEQVRGELALAAASRCSADLSRLHLDMTAVRFTGGYTGSALVAKGWAADRTIGRQVKTMQVSTRAGVAVYYRPHPGGSNEAPCFADTLERIRELAPPGVVCVIDSGFGHLSKLCAADAAGLQFVVPLRADTGWAGWFAADVADGLAALDRLDHCSQRQRRLPTHERLIEADLRAALGPDTPLPGILPEHRDAVPTARAVLAAFTDLHATYTSGGFVLDRLTTVQRLTLAHLDIPLPWPETHSTPTTSKTTDLNPQLCGKRG